MSSLEPLELNTPAGRDDSDGVAGVSANIELVVVAFW